MCVQRECAPGCTHLQEGSSPKIWQLPEDMEEGDRQCALGAR